MEGKLKLPAKSNLWLQRVRMLVRIIFIGCAASLMHPIVQPQANPQRVASINLCADQLLLALADRDQIAGVSGNAKTGSLSFLAKKANGIPVIRGNAEELLNLRADLVLMGTYDRPLVQQILRSKKIPFVALSTWQSIAMGRNQITRLARVLGQEKRGREMIADIDKAIKILRDQKSRLSVGKSIIVLQRRGYVLQSGIINELLEIAGFKDIAAQLKLGASGIASLETLISQRPDFILVESSFRHPADQGEAKLIHPVLARLYPPDRRLVLPPKLAICAGPATPILIRTLADEIAKKLR